MRPLQIEVIYKGHQCPSCFYMVKAVEEVLLQYGHQISLQKVEYLNNRQDACRLYELSVILYGEEAVRKKGRFAPIPSLFINGELVFDYIPPRHDLVDAINFFLLNFKTEFRKDSPQ